MKEDTCECGEPKDGHWGCQRCDFLDGIRAGKGTRNATTGEMIKDLLDCYQEGRTLQQLSVSAGVTVRNTLRLLRPLQSTGRVESVKEWISNRNDYQWRYRLVGINVKTAKALLACEGKCGKATRHEFVVQKRVTDKTHADGESWEHLFKCTRCGATRRYGLTEAKVRGLKHEEMH